MPLLGPRITPDTSLGSLCYLYVGRHENKQEDAILHQAFRLQRTPIHLGFGVSDIPDDRQSSATSKPVSDNRPLVLCWPASVPLVVGLSSPCLPHDSRRPRHPSVPTPHYRQGCRTTPPWPRGTSRPNLVRVRGASSPLFKLYLRRSLANDQCSPPLPDE